MPNRERRKSGIESPTFGRDADEGGDIYIMMQFCLLVTKNEHFFCWFSWVMKVVSWFFVGFHGFSRWFHGFSWFLVGFHGFSRWFRSVESSFAPKCT